MRPLPWKTKNRGNLIQTLVGLAKSGDTTAAKLLLERALPALKPAMVPVMVPTKAGGSLSEMGRGILEAALSGQLTADQASMLLSGLSSLARVTEVDELTKRVEALERGDSEHGQTESAH